MKVQRTKQAAAPAAQVKTPAKKVETQTAAPKPAKKVLMPQREKLVLKPALNILAKGMVHFIVAGKDGSAGYSTVKNSKTETYCRHQDALGRTVNEGIENFSFTFHNNTVSKLFHNGIELKAGAIPKGKIRDWFTFGWVKQGKMRIASSADFWKLHDNAGVTIGEKKHKVIAIDLQAAKDFNEYGRWPRRICAVTEKGMLIDAIYKTTPKREWCERALLLHGLVE